MRLTVIAITLAICASASGAAEPSADRQVALTIYNSDLALIQHIRPVKLAAGVQRIEFAGVSAQIIPETVSVISPSLELIEQNFDYDLLTPAKMMDKAIGQKVRLLRTNPATGQQSEEVAEVLSTTDGVVLKIGNRIEVLREDGLPTRVIFDHIPENLRAQPTLSVLANAARPVSEDVRLTYLSKGFSWRADYVGVFDESKGQLALQGWITLDNKSGTSFSDAQVQLVAGDINIVGNESEWWERQRQRQTTTMRKGPIEATPQPQLADYYLYPLEQPTTIANNQTKQVSFLAAEAVKASKGYESVFYGFNSNDSPVAVDVRLRFENSKSRGLGAQLPAGVVRLYARDAKGQPQFIGEDHIDHTGGGSELALKVGEAFDVTVQADRDQVTKISDRMVETSMIYTLRNARSTPVTVTLRQAGLWGQTKVFRESQSGHREDGRSYSWDVTVPANGESHLAFAIRQSW